MHDFFRAGGRSALLVFAAAIVAVGVVGLVERYRLASLDRELATLSTRIAVAERDDARSDRLNREVRRQRDLGAAIDAARDDTALAANTIVRLGNRLPAQTWLTKLESVRSGSWTIRGRSARLDDIRVTLAAVARLDRTASARLVSVDAAGSRSPLLDFTIALERPR